MAVRAILRWPDARLTCVCAAVSGDVRALAADLLDTMYDAPGRGLAAPQIGAALRLFVMDATWKDGLRAPQVFVNPEILWRSDARATGPEGCLSLPGLTAQVERAVSVRLRWADLDGMAQEETLTGFAAICAQHEYDHLDGILTLDHMDQAARAAAERAMQ
jgi:peptide deformylase